MTDIQYVLEWLHSLTPEQARELNDELANRPDITDMARHILAEAEDRGIYADESEDRGRYA